MELYIGPPRTQVGDRKNVGTAPRYLHSGALAPEGRKVVERVASSLQAQAGELFASLDQAGELAAVAPLVDQAGEFAADDEEHRDRWVPFPAAWAAGGNCFAFEVAGESMTPAGFLAGDIAIVREQDTALAGEIVAATVEGQIALKHYLPSDRVRGRVVGLLREYR